MSIFKIKKFLTAASIFGALALATGAQAKEINLVITYPEGGNAFRQSQMLADSLTKTGYRVNVVRANTCPNARQFFNNNPQTPAIVLQSDLAYVEQQAVGCDLLPITKDNFVTTAYFRINAMCSSAAVHSNAESALALFKSNTPVTVASSISTPVSVIESLTTALGKKVTMVPYSGTGGSVRGVLGRDADFWYGGLTAGIATNQELFCWGNTGSTVIRNMIPLAELVPGYSQSAFGSYWYIQSNGLDTGANKAIKQDIDTIFANSKWSKFMADGFLTPGHQLKNIDVNDILENIDNLK